MIPLADRYASVLQALLTVWKSDQFIIIGAAAIACQMDFRWRGTVDLDLSVASRPEAYPRDGEASLVRRGRFTWPDGSARMTLVGLRLAFADAVPVELSQGILVRVASLRSLVVLKIAAFLDRPWERDSDLEDTAHILAGYVAPDADERWSDEVVSLGMDFEDVSSYVLGKQLGALVDEAERGLVAGFLAALDDPADRLNTLPRMAQRAPASWRDQERLRLRMAAFRRGFES